MDGMERQSSLRGGHVRPRLPLGPRSRQSSTSARVARSQTTTPAKEQIEDTTPPLPPVPVTEPVQEPVQEPEPEPEPPVLPPIQTQLTADDAPLLTPIPPSPANSEHPTTTTTELPSQIEHYEHQELPHDDDEPAPRYSTVIDRPEPEPPAFSLTPSPSMSPSISPSPVPSLTPKPPVLTPIPPIQLEPPPLAYKGMSLQTAQWTLTSEELQTIVSRTIRSSARESFIRLLGLDTLDTAIPQDLARLESAKLEGGARLRWLTHRRGMLLQALLSSTLAGGESAELVASLAQQLHALAVESDMVVQNVIQSGALLAQIQSLVDVHAASALSIALRKLNASFSKRTEELLQARKKISELECQVEEAWAAAEKVAKEADDDDDSERRAFEAERAQWALERERFGEERKNWEQERKELLESQVVNVHHPQTVNVHHAKSVTVTRKGSLSSIESDAELDEDAEIQRAEVLFMPKSPPPTLGHMRSKSSLTFGPQATMSTAPASFEFVPAEKIKISVEIPQEPVTSPPTATSTSITPSTPSRSRSRASQVAAAKRRSRQPSLRLPKSVLGRRSAAPPVPNIPQDVKADGSGSDTETDEDMDQLMRIAQLGARASTAFEAPTPIEEPVPRPSSSLAIHRPTSMDSHITGGIGSVTATADTAPSLAAKTVDDIGVFNKSTGPSGAIPSIWSQANDRPASLDRNPSSSYFPPAGTSTIDGLSDLPLEPVRPMPVLTSRFSVTPGTERPPNPPGPSAQHKGLLKLKGLTKRYSLPFPVFTGSGHGKAVSKKPSLKRDEVGIIEEEGGGIGSSPLIRVHKA